MWDKVKKLWGKTNVSSAAVLLPAQTAASAADLSMQVAVRARLYNMLTESISNICRTVFPEDLSWVGQPKQVQVKLLMVNQQKLQSKAPLCTTNTFTGVQTLLQSRNSNV